ncbi:MAG: ribonuclease P [Nanoarchaeota archaeon]
MARRSYRKKPERQTSLAMQRVRTLIEQADAIFERRPDLSDRYAWMARRISMKNKLRLPSEIKRRICKGCEAFLVPGKTARIRTNRGNVVIYCIACKRVTRVGYSKKKRPT